MQLRIRSLWADEVKTDKLCIGETCITETELKELLQSRVNHGSNSSSYTPSETLGGTGNTDTVSDTASGTTSSTGTVDTDDTEVIITTGSTIEVTNDIVTTVTEDITGENTEESITIDTHTSIGI
jgi:hypothetical protein